MKNRQLLTEMERLERDKLAMEEKSANRIKSLESRIAELEHIMHERDLNPTGDFGGNVLFRSEIPGDKDLPVIAWNDVNEAHEIDEEMYAIAKKA